MNSALIRASLAVIGLSLFSGCAGEDPEAQVLRRALGPIAGGETDRNNTSVFGLFNQNSGGSCTGTLIAPNLVLTAQHCIADVPTQFVICGQTQFGDIDAPDGFLATSNVQLFGSRDFYQGEEVFVPPGNRDLCSEDIALIILSQNVPASETVPYIPRIDIPATRGEDYVAVGYGNTSDAGGSGTRRILVDREVRCYGSDCDQFGGQVQDGEFVGSDGTCQGDSGGPALDPQLRVFGVLSRGGQGCTSSTYTDVSFNSDWMRSIGEQAADRGGYTAPFWVTSGVSELLNDRDDDLVDDSVDNCPDVANESQEDADEDGLGDVCDPQDDRDRGGSCSVCNGCSDDAHCGVALECLNFGDGGVCTQGCETAEDCPGNTLCFDIPVGGTTRGLCLNDDAGEAGVCAESFVCGEEVIMPELTCDVCNSCEVDDDCLEGLCLNFGQGGVCTADCSEAGCPGDSRCFEVSGQNVCLNPDAGGGLCPAAYECGELSGAPEAPEGSGAAEGTGEGADAGSEEPTRQPGVSATGTSSSCAAAPVLAGQWFAVLALMVLRRRKTRSA